MDRVLRDLLEWAKGNRGTKRINPYLVPEVKAALRYLAQIDGIPDYLDVDTRQSTGSEPELANKDYLFSGLAGYGEDEHER